MNTGNWASKPGSNPIQMETTTPGLDPVAQQWIKYDENETEPTVQYYYDSAGIYYAIKLS